MSDKQAVHLERIIDARAGDDGELNVDATAQELEKYLNDPATSGMARAEVGKALAMLEARKVVAAGKQRIGR